MKLFIKKFCKRGLMWGAWVGPTVLTIVWLCLKRAGIVDTLSVEQAVKSILTTEILGFIAAGVSTIYTIESIPTAIAGLIQCAVMYADYMIIYLINGWLPKQYILMFTAIFLTGFAMIWFAIYISILIKVDRMNKLLEK